MVQTVKLRRASSFLRTFHLLAVVRISNTSLMKGQSPSQQGPAQTCRRLRVLSTLNFSPSTQKTSVPLKAMAKASEPNALSPSSKHSKAFCQGSRVGFLALLACRTWNPCLLRTELCDGAMPNVCAPQTLRGTTPISKTLPVPSLIYASPELFCLLGTRPFLCTHTLLATHPG